MALINLLIFATLFVVFYALLINVFVPRAKVTNRVQTLTGKTREKSSSSRKEPRPRRKRTQAWMSQLEHALHRAEIDLTAHDYVTRWAMITVCLAVVMILLLGALGALLAISVSFIGTLLYLRARGQRRVKRINDDLHDMLTIVANSLRAGHSFAQSLHVVAEELEGPMKEELQRIEAEMQVGVGVEEALERANDRIGSDDFDLVVTAILIQRQVGGNLAEVLEKITETIRERIRLKREVKALTAQGRLSAGLFMFMPPGLGVILYMINPSYVGALFTSTLGWALIIMAAMGQGVGYFIIRKIVNVEL